MDVYFSQQLKHDFSQKQIASRERDRERKKGRKKERKREREREKVRGGERKVLNL